MDHDDPILLALAHGDAGCPDGESLVRLGRLIRDVARPPRTVELLERVRSACREAPDAEVEEDRLIDEIFEEHDAAAAAVAPDLSRLSVVVREAARPPEPVALLPRLEGRLSAAGRSARRRILRLDPALRARIYTAVIVGHVAALLALAILQVQTGSLRSERRSSPPPVYRTDLGKLYQELRLREAAGLAASGQLPADWNALVGRRQDLFLLRGTPDARLWAKRRYGVQGCSVTVSAFLDGMLRQFDRESGTFAAPRGGQAEDLATQSAAVLALLGEGTDDQRRAATARRALAWIGEQSASVEGPHGGVAGGLAALALVEGALLFDDLDLREKARQALEDLGRTFDPAFGWSGQSGFVVLAVATAQVGDIAVPLRLRELPRQTAMLDTAGRHDPGLLGLVVFARRITGMELGALPERLIEACGAAANAPGAVDPMDWFFASLALRELGGEAWDAWAERLQRGVLSGCRYGADGMAWVPAERLPHRLSWPGADILATALALLDLQVPYRYLPLTPPRG